MVQKLRERSRGEGGFTLVELLVVMLILGLLAAIAIPSFFNQRDKARDADAKSSARTAQTAIETYATDNRGSYAGATAADLAEIENTLTNVATGDPDAVPPVPAALAVDVAGTAVDGDATSYIVSVTSETDNVFSIARTEDGATVLFCETGGDGGCPTDGNWG